MIRAAPVLGFALLLAAAGASAGSAPLQVGRGERLLVVAPHPDDETIGAGGLIERVHSLGGVVRVVLITAGDGYIEAVMHETGSPKPRPKEFIAFGEQRLREARAALRILAPDHSRLQVLGFPDGGLDGLLQAHWWRSHPERSRTTQATDPPYDREVLEPDIPYDGDDLRRELERVIRETRPTIIALPDPLDRHPDHRAAGLFTLLALADSVADRPTKDIPELLAYLVHWPAWPAENIVEAHRHDETALELPDLDLHDGGTRVSLALTDQEVAIKFDALQRYVTQLGVMRSFLTAFVRHTEPYTILPASEMTQVAQMIERGVGPAPRPRPTRRHGNR